MSYQKSDIILKIIGWLIVFPLLLVRIHHCRYTYSYMSPYLVDDSVIVGEYSLVQ